MYSSEDIREPEDSAISTEELLDQSIIIDKALIRKNSIIILVLTLLYIALAIAARNISGAQIILMSIYAGLALPGINGLVGKIGNIRNAEKRKKALKDGTYEIMIPESEEETRKKIIDKINYFPEYLRKK